MLRGICLQTFIGFLSDELRSTCGPSRHFVAQRNLVEVGAWRTLAGRPPGRFMGSLPKHWDIYHQRRS